VEVRIQKQPKNECRNIADRHTNKQIEINISLFKRADVSVDIYLISVHKYDLRLELEAGTKIESGIFRHTQPIALFWAVQLVHSDFKCVTAWRIFRD